jgi:hypothetical protein
MANVAPAGVTSDITATPDGLVLLTTSSGRTAVAWTPADARTVAAALVATADEIEAAARLEKGCGNG